MKDELTIKQEKYAQGLFAGLTQREAYKRAYNCTNMGDKTIDAESCRMAGNYKMTARIEALKEKFTIRNMVTIERVLQEYAKLGFFDPRKLFNDDGSPVEIKDLDDSTAMAIAGIDVQETFEGTGSDRKFTGYTKKYKLVDKKGTLDSMARYLGMFIDRTEITGKDGGAIEIDSPRERIERKLALIAERTNGRIENGTGNI